MNKKIFILIVVSIFLIGIVGATDYLGSFKKGDNVRISQSCSDSTYITIQSISLQSNSTPLVENVPMTDTGLQEYYYMFNLTNIIGRYDVREISDGCEQNVINYFDITETGNIPSSSQGLLSIGIIASILLLMLFFGWLSFKFIENDEMFGIGLFFLVMSLILSLYSLFLGFIFSRDYLFTNVSAVQEKVFLSGLFGLTGIMFIAFILLIVKVIKELKVKRTDKKYGEGYNQKTKVYDY